MKEVLISGGSGFLGHNLVDQLQGYDILAPTHRELNLDDTEAVRNYLKEHRVDAIVHCATKGDRTEDNDLRMFFNLAEAKIPMIHLGSGAEYGKHRPIVKVKEEDFGKVVPVDNYGFSKYMMSRYIQGVDHIVCLRPFGVFGKYEDKERRFISNAIGRALNGKPIIIYKDLKFDYLYVDDFVRIVDWFLKSGAGFRHYNLGGHTVILREVARKVCQLAGTHKVKVLDKSGMGNEYTADNSRLSKEIDLHLTPFDVALKELFDWYKNG